MPADIPPPASPLSTGTTANLAQTNGPGLQLDERCDIGMILVRGKPDNSAFLETFKTLFGAMPPADQYIVHSTPLTISRMGPIDFLISGPFDSVEALALKAEVASIGAPFHATSISHGRVVIDMAGKNAKALVSKSCGLDLREAAFPIGTGTRTRFAEIVGYIERIENNTFRLIADRSLAEYLSAWIAHIGASGTAI
ncbi:MAG: sarcosine oxidase subunit gamma family protein [Pseudomonadota bacterium]